MTVIRIILGLLLTIAVGYLSLQIISISKERQTVVLENTELKHIKYGLLSVHAWKRQVSDIMAKNVREFELSPENKEEMRKNIQEMLHKMLVELEGVIEDKISEGGSLKVYIKSLIEKPVDRFMQELRAKVPELTETILEVLEKEENRAKLRDFLQQKMDDALDENVGEEDLATIRAIVQKNNCTDIAHCSQLLQTKLAEIDKDLSDKSRIIVIISILIFIILLLGNKNKGVMEYAILIGLCGILLGVGVSTPMIEIDARIEQFQFLLMGESLAFKDQILFFQSKSIFEVVQILMATKEAQSMFVGGLILLFSIIFPILKLMASLALGIKNKLYDNPFVHFLALKSGKWSMADVLVVAIFMSYIGFKGVLDNQLGQLENMNERIEMLTTDHSSLGVGFTLFLSFCLGGLLLATIMERDIKRKRAENK